MRLCDKCRIRDNIIIYVGELKSSSMQRAMALKEGGRDVILMLLSRSCMYM